MGESLAFRRGRAEGVFAGFANTRALFTHVSSVHTLHERLCMFHCMMRLECLDDKFEFVLTLRLAVMSFNVYWLLAVVVGAGVGEMMFGRFGAGGGVQAPQLSTAQDQ